MCKLVVMKKDNAMGIKIRIHILIANTVDLMILKCSNNNMNDTLPIATAKVIECQCLLWERKTDSPVSPKSFKLVRGMP